MHYTEMIPTSVPTEKGKNDMGEPTYWEQLIIIAMLLASPIEHQAKEDLIKKFCKKFNKTEEELLRDLKGAKRK